MKYFKGAIFILILFLVGCGKGEIESNMPDESFVADFEFITQDNEKLGLNDLKGEWWVADFIFTNCTTVCIPMSLNMVKLQEMMAEEELDAQIISFSVDPEVDTPEVLKNYAEGYGADLSNWAFLTGYDFETIKDLSIGSFYSDLRDDPGSDQVTHGIRFYLVNPEGEIVKNYLGTDLTEIDAIIDDLKKVL
jgi:protein SCO1/2